MQPQYNHTPNNGVNGLTGKNGHGQPGVKFGIEAGPDAGMEPGMETVYQRPVALHDVRMHYCPGCTHGIVHRLIAEVIDELGIRERTIGVAPVGCAVYAYQYFNVDGCQAAHGRAPAMATGIKRVLPGHVVFTYQGDGDLASIGGNEILHTAARGESITVIFVNNGLFGMTGGQMAPTSLVGQVTTSSPGGRSPQQHGYPIHIPEMLALLPGVAYAVRRSMHSQAEIRRTKKALRTAFEAQLRGLGLSIVEVLSTCPTNWRVSATEAMDYIRDQMAPVYPIGDFRVAPQLKEG